MACSFSGEGAEKQAKELVFELRKRYNCPPTRTKPNSNSGKRRGGPRAKDGCEWRYAKYKDKPKAEVDEVGVLVGNYPTADDPAAQETRHTLKYAKPKCLEVKDETPSDA